MERQETIAIDTTTMPWEEKYQPALGPAGKSTAKPKNQNSAVARARLARGLPE